MFADVFSVLKRKTSMRSGLIPFMAMALFLALAANARAGSLTVTKTISEKQQAAASAYWTREKIAATRTVPLPVDKGLAQPDTAAVEEMEALGPMGSEPPAMADPDAARIARLAYAQDWADLDKDRTDGTDEAADSTAGTSGIYTSYDVNTNTALWQIYPHVWTGKLVFSTSGGGASCSATSIKGNTFVTAAHCVYDTTNNVFYSNWVFAPAYRNGSAPYGTFTATACTVLTAWTNLSGSYSINSWTRYDVAVCSVGNNSAGQSLSSAVGYAGKLWNAGNNQLVFLSGYPAKTYTDATISNGPAQYLRSCTAETFLQTTDTLGSGCNWGAGISGGPWLTGYKPFVVSGQINSVVSGLYIGQQNLYGIRFTSNNIVTLCSVRGC